jgi:gamma-glutamylaminecyclotransferase
MHLFVYGTLKRGQSRHRFLAGQKFIGAARTKALYRLYNLGEYPGLVPAADGVSIEGELWDVRPAQLEVLDREEGCDAGLYRRHKVVLAEPHDRLCAVTYFYQESVRGRPDCGNRW